MVLSGALDDGTAGMIAVKRRGGVALVQDPDTARHPGMPRSVIEPADVDLVLPVRAMGTAIATLVGELGPPEDSDGGPDVVLMDESAVHEDQRPGTPSAFSCPECSGVLWAPRPGEDPGAQHVD